MGKRSEILEDILKERERQVGLSGSEYDVNNSPNDWIAIASYYLVKIQGEQLCLPHHHQMISKMISQKASQLFLRLWNIWNTMKDKKDLS